MQKYTIEDLARMDKNMLTPQDVCHVLGMDPQTIRLRARNCPERLGFPVSTPGTRTLIPRIPFLRFMGLRI